MRYTVRDGCFETNSSMTHSIVIDTEENFQKWINAELILDNYTGRLVPMEEYDKANGFERRYRFIPYFEFGRGLETEIGSFTSPSGDKLRWRTYYGYDG